MSTTNNDFTVIKGKGLHSFSIRPVSAINSVNETVATDKNTKNKKA